MDRLLIVGNGFDLSHGLKTRYTDFKEYLLKKQREFQDEKSIKTSLSKLKQIREKLVLCSDFVLLEDDLTKLLVSDNYKDTIIMLYKEYSSYITGKMYEYEELNHEISIEQLEQIGRAIYDMISIAEHCQRRIVNIPFCDNLTYEEIDEIDKIEFIIQTIDGLDYFMQTKKNYGSWSALEEACGYADFSYLEDNLPDGIFDDKEGDLDPSKKDDLIELTVAPFIQILSDLSDYFSEWVPQIDTSKTKVIDEIQDFLDLADITCLTFNYTEILEEYYNQKNVFHIHGKMQEKIYFGHDSKENAFDAYENEFTIPDAIMAAREALRKDTNRILKEKEYFFNGLDKSIKDIYVYGFSFGEVDNPYLKYLNGLFPNAKWHIQSYISKDYLEYSSRLAKIGIPNNQIEHWYI